MKLIALDINNLTDARYFAARGACMIGFSTRLSTIEEVNAIAGWIDVPEFFLRIERHTDPDHIWEWQERTGIKNMLISELPEETMALFHHIRWMKFLHDVIPEGEADLNAIFIDSNALATWRNMDENTKHLLSDIPFYLHIDLNAVPADALEDFEGVIISGSDEEMVGVKSYDEIENFLDRLGVGF